MDKIKPDQERVKNLLLDTVTLLCKNSLQYENYLRVEGLLGVAVDDNDTFFLHISERFQSDAYIEKLNAEREEKEAAARKKEQEEKEEEQRQLEKENEAAKASLEASESLAVKVKTEAQEADSDGEDLIITGSSGLQSPQTVAQQASMVAGQRRAPRRPHSPSNDYRGSQNRGQGDSDYQTQNSPFVQSDSGDGSFSQYDNNQSVKAEEQWDGPPAKRQSMSNPWPNVTSMGELSLQAAQASFADADGQFSGGGGDLSQPGCSAWPTNLQSGSQDSMDLSGQRSIGAPMSLDMGERYLQYGCHVARKCPYCGKLISTQYARHLKTHTDYKPFMCCICPARFTRMDHLKRHTRKIHNTDLETLTGQTRQSTLSRSISAATVAKQNMETVAAAPTSPDSSSEKKEES